MPWQKENVPADDLNVMWDMNNVACYRWQNSLNLFMLDNKYYNHKLQRC